MESPDRDNGNVRTLNMHSFKFLRPAGSTIATRPNRLRIALFAVLGLLLFWLILSRSLVAYLAMAAPEQALFLRSNEPASLLILADRELNSTDKDKTKTAGTPGRPAKALGTTAQTSGNGARGRSSQRTGLHFAGSVGRGRTSRPKDNKTDAINATGHAPFAQRDHGGRMGDAK